MSIRLALECPTKMLEMVQPFADFDFVLAHLYLKDEVYAKYYKESTRFKILDNSTNELGEPCSLEDIKTAADSLNPNYVVAPDWVGDAPKTLEAFSKAVEIFGLGKVIPVIQGATLEEAINCANAYEKGLMAVPYDIGSIKSESPEVMALRRALLISNLPLEMSFHLLGFTSLQEFQFYARRPNVVSIDTGVPIMLGLTGKDILDPLDKKTTPTYNQMEAKPLDQKSWTGVCRNLALLRKYLV